jgi:pimeloyl-ACP methyl ester carboxylesterase
MLLPHVGILVCYDLRGHGESTRRRCDWAVAEAYYLHVILDQIQDLSEGALKGAGNGPVVLLGYSMGAAASLLAATEDPDWRIAGVIGEGVGGARLQPIAAVLRLRKMPVEPMLSFARLFLQVTRLWPRPLDMLPWMHKVACPVLLLHGRDDRICPLASARRIAEAIPHAQLRIIDTDEHLDLAAADPEGYLEAVRAFLDRLGSVQPMESAAHEPAPGSV